ncbi:hypothetical protein [Paenibacillus crassostreae]|uniref:hypothetical protein n=1 Tax=Paenibacillus crassostreae TaxID=1763538 RepID=UPI000838193D|nr:hypothetical protein [Paenibacillus crassostreae]AOZ91193.1 hypothetical protein LPB68_02525 [Paenibacillus crassostreae]
MKKKILFLCFIFAVFFVACSNEQTFDEYFHTVMEDMHEYEEDKYSYSLVHQEHNVVHENDAIAIFTENNLQGEQIFIAYFERENENWKWRQTRGAEWNTSEQWSSMHEVPYIYSGTINDDSISEVFAGEEPANIIEVDGDKMFWYAISNIKDVEVKIVKKDGTPEVIDKIKHASFFDTESEHNLTLSIISIYGEFQLDGNQLIKLFDYEAWNRQNVPSPEEQSASITINITSKVNEEIRFYNSDPSLAMVKRGGEFRYYKIPESEYDLIHELVLATAWAEGLQTRDGQQRYEMMSEEMKEKFKQEQIVRSGEDWNFNIGVSSPWVVDFKVELDGTSANITYVTKTTEPAYYNTMETITFGKENETLVVVDYIVEDQ